MNPATPLGAVVVVVGGVEVADQYSGEAVAQSFIHHFLVAAPPQEIALGGCGESPDAAIGAVLAPTGFIGVDHWAGADTVHNPCQFRLAPSGHLVNGSDDGAEAQPQLMNGAQKPLDGAEGQPALFPPSRHQAEQIDAQPLLPQRHARQVRWRHPALLTYWQTRAI